MKNSSWKEAYTKHIVILKFLIQLSEMYVEKEIS